MEVYGLGGAWSVRLDAEKRGIEEKYYGKDCEYELAMELPGTVSQAHLGIKNEKRETGFLTDEYEFKGWVWFSRVLDPKVEDRGSVFRLYLERTRLTRVWVDGHEVRGENADSLNAPHIYDITDYVGAEPFRLTIMVSNDGYPTGGGHLTSPDTQTNWIGICGRIALEVRDEEFIDSIRVEPDVKSRAVSLKMNWVNTADTQGNLSLNIKVTRLCLAVDGSLIEEEHIPLRGGEPKSLPVSGVILPPGRSMKELLVDMGENAVLWSEYSPVIYKIAITGIDDTYYGDAVFGFRDITTDEHHFYVNGEKTFLRGKHDGMIFPKTGAAPTDIKSWVEVLRTAKEYGINHYRFHTCCPPEAAFYAADLVGIYMSPELPFWGTIAAPGEEGYKKEEQEYLINEGFRMMEAFGNHPSYAFMSLGNELWGSSERLNEILGDFKRADSRHLYTQGSNNFQFVPCIVENDDYFVGVRFAPGKLIRGSYAMCDAPQGFVQTDKPNTSYSYDKVFAEFTGSEENGGGEIEIQYGTGTRKVKAEGTGSLVLNKPVVSHEIGQYGIYPHYKEIGKYTGSLKPRNLEVFRERLEEAGLGDFANDYFINSGALAVACYKLELEAAMRSRMLAGFQLLDLQDFTGQGTALVGILDAFMENKGLISAKEWRQFCSDAVVMAEFDDFVVEAGQTFKANIYFNAYRPSLFERDEPLQLMWSLYEEGRISVDYSDVDRILIKTGLIDVKLREKGVNDCGSIEFTIPDTIMPERFKLVLEVGGEKISNSYELYSFARKNDIDIYPADRSRVSVVSSVDEAEKALAQGKNTVLFIGTDKEYVEGTYCTDFWNYPMFKGISDWMKKPRPIGTMGLLINAIHPALYLFPSAVHTTPQWYDIITGAKLNILDGTQIMPIVSAIDNVERNHRLALAWEVKTGGGNLLVVARPLEELMDSAAGRQFAKSILCYAATDDFEPVESVDIEKIREIV